MTAEELLLEKVGDHLAAGTLLVWVVDPRWSSVTVHRPAREIRLLSEDGTLDGEDVVPGFRCPVRDLFAGAISGRLRVDPCARRPSMRYAGRWKAH